MSGQVSPGSAGEYGSLAWSGIAGQSGEVDWGRGCEVRSRAARWLSAGIFRVMA